jgi:hypothetical protein
MLAQFRSVGKDAATCAAAEPKGKGNIAFHKISLKTCCEVGFL